MPEIEAKEKRAKSSLSEFQAFSEYSCCRQTKYNSSEPKTRSGCESRAKEAADVLQRLPAAPRSEGELLEAGILKKRSGDYEGAHRLLNEAYALNPNNVKTLHELAQTKSRLARILKQRRQTPPRSDVEALRKKLLEEEEGLLRKAIQLADDPTRLAWCWHDLAWTLRNLRQPDHEIEQAFLSARTLAPQEEKFERDYETWRRSRSRPQS